jgi:hypothetical protein
MKSISRVHWVALTVLAVCTAGCSKPQDRVFVIGSERVPATEILPFGSESYDAKQKQLKYDLRQAGEILAQRLREEDGTTASTRPVPLGAHYVLVKDCYVFTILHSEFRTDWVPLRGTYVNGNTGEVREVQSREWITPGQQRKLWGKEVRRLGNTLWK